VIIVASAIGMFAGIFCVTFLKGWMNQRLEAGVETEYSHLQLHHPGFSENNDLMMWMADGIAICDQLTGVEGIEGASPRLVLQTMVASAETGSGVKLTGVFPDREKNTANLYKYVTEGTWFDSRVQNPVVIGKKLAEKLNVKLKSKIVVTFQDTEGNITSGAFRIFGIFDITNNGFEEVNLFARYHDLTGMVKLPSGVAHEITVHLNDRSNPEKIKNHIAATNPGTKVLCWQELSPEFGFIIELGDLYAFAVVILILIALGFGIVNTMLMVVLERIKELGMLMAIGMNKKRVFLMLMAETVLLTLTGSVIGIALGILFCRISGQTGIDLSMFAQGFEDIGRSSVVYPVLETETVMMIIILVITTGILASLYPAGKAIRYKPADALRIDI
jgi:ABC-type lipoprotein release transport system permease subunit